jgi:CheY-like chemotaxis protein
MSKILIAEDEILVAYQLSQQLNRRGFEVLETIAATGEEAIRISRAESPEVILMDIGLAGRLNGIETALSIREFSHPGIIFVSGYADQAVKAEALSLAGALFLEKPVHVNKIIEALNQLTA